MTGLIDTHAHLDEIEDLPSAITDARSNGVKAIIAVGQDLKSNRRVLELASEYSGFIYAALGNEEQLAQATTDNACRFFDL